MSALEKKEIANEVKKDLLFSTHEPAKKRAKKSSKSIIGEDEPASDVSVDRLSYNLLQPGSLVLAQVTQISQMEVVVALANDMTGFLAITNISDEITAQLEAYDAQENSSDEDMDDDDESVTVNKSKKTVDFPELSSIFKVGQWISAQVLSNVDDAQKKKIELTTEPSRVNSTVDPKEDLVANYTLQASIKSVEDHGYILNFGTAIKQSGFISKKDLPTAYQVGSVLLVSISKSNASTITCKLPQGSKPLAESSNLDSLLPGLLVNVTINETSANGLVVKAYGICDGSINDDHLNIPTISSESLKERFSIGSSIKARILATYMKNGTKKLALSLLPQLLTLTTSQDSLDALQAFPIGHVFDSVTIKGKDSDFIFIDIQAGSIPARAHKSKVGKKADLDLDFKIGSKHKARILSYSCVDNCYIVTLNPEAIEKKYLRPQDIEVGSKVDCVVDRVTEKGIFVKVEDQFQAFVDSNNISDIKLNYPERKFKVGGKFKGRLIKTYSDGISTRLFVTFKKSLVNAEEDEIVTQYSQLTPQKKALATIVKILPFGCVCAFFNDVTAFLPNAEISEAFVKSAKDHVKLGQTVRVRVVDANTEEKKYTVSLRVSSDFSKDQLTELKSLRPGKSVIQAKIISKERDVVNVQLGESQLSGVINVLHLSDGIEDEARHTLKKLKVNSSIEVLILQADEKNKSVTLTAKPSLIKDAKNGSLPVSFKDIQVSDRVLHGFIKSVIPTGVFISFADRLTGLVIPKYASEKQIKNLTTVFRPNQSVKCTVVDIDNDNKRFLLSLRSNSSNVDADVDAQNPIDKSIKTLGDFVPGKITKCTIQSIEENNTGLIVKLADNQNGRIDVSEVVDLSSLESGSNAATELKKFNKGKKLDVKVLGFTNVTNGGFRSFKKESTDLVELAAKKEFVESSDVVRPLSFEDVSFGDDVVGYVQSVLNDNFLVTVSPNLKVFISFTDLTNEISQLDEILQKYQAGSIVKAKVSGIDNERHSINVSARSSAINSIGDVKVDDIVPASIVKVTDSGVVVSLGHGVTARADPADCLDDYDQKIEESFKVGQVIPAKVYNVDSNNRRVSVLLRRSATSSSKSAPKDKVITSSDDLKRGDVVRGFIVKFVNAGLIVGLGHEIVALVRIADLSDAFIKDWKSGFALYQVVTGKILSSEGKGRVLMSLKNSVVTGKLADNKGLSDIKIGQIYEGTVKSALEYGVFINLEGTDGISGLCHRSEISDSKIENCQDLFAPGDKVKVKVLKIDSKKNKLALGMKASYFMDEDVEINGEEDEDSDVEMDEANEDEASDAESGIDYNDQNSEESDEDSDSESEAEESKSNGLSAGGLSAGFDWTASVLEQAKEVESEDEEEEFRNAVDNKKSKKAEIEDKTADLATRAPQSVSDFERLLIGNPDSSLLWIQYMSFQLQLSEVSKAREVAERALKSISYREEHEKLNIWVALLNLENSFGDEESLEAAYKKSCQYMDEFTMQMKMVSIFIASEKFEKADELFNVIIKKSGSKTPSVWVSYAEFLIDREQNEEAHAILARALQILPKKNHIEVVRKFAALEFRKGDLEQGRSLFEGLLADVPKRVDLWNIYIDQELKYGDKKHVDDLFERLVERKLTRKQAKYFFGKWLAYEESMEDEKAQDYVKAKAAEYAEKLSN